jgi:hypothetical protein
MLSFYQLFMLGFRCAASQQGAARDIFKQKKHPQECLFVED